MKAFSHHLRAPALQLSLAWVLSLGALGAVAADKKPDDKQGKAADKASADAKKAIDPKAAAKGPAPVLTKTPPIVVEFPKSTFLTAVEAGQDPFYPSSKRRLPKAPPAPKPNPPAVTPNTVVIPPIIASTNLPTTVSNAIPTAALPPPDLIGSANLTLRGLSGTKTRRVAVVHSGARTYDFLKGDTALIRLPNDKQLKVRCTEIRDRSAVFEAEGETKELFLREGVF